MDIERYLARQRVDVREGGVMRVAIVGSGGRRKRTTKDGIDLDFVKKILYNYGRGVTLIVFVC